MHITVPDGKDPTEYVWTELVPEIGRAARRFSRTVTAESTLGLREFEAARLRIAQINGCIVCMDWRTERDGVRVESTFGDAVEQWKTTDSFDVRTRLAAEYAERYAVDHHGLEDEFWGRMSAQYSQAEIVELSISIGSWITSGRLNHVLGLDTVCAIPVSD
ncbi:carboxymuconolactone decarboxylase family protein [Rhodococcus sp. ARC_M6]|uniref:carboxymuconolactone decarboxylase family protein n=1 Tax=Rhodococcus sp. ARC_M6 TaxID=2928852 RepID=UPI001FB1F771|nr:carboxymuconolactone decarboxylase family protein [Rhodococcus sp. ARC_M6]MCJ0904768.1 carboxymuconolactone decarboxylase family protein [Rhodococcus sp. ARC_M6]